MITIISFIVILGILVLVHECGHFISARKLGVGVEEFGIGFPPRLLAVKKGGIVYSLNLIPIGGFVKIKGEDGPDDDPGSFSNQVFWKKAIIVSAGVLMNFALAIVVLSAVFYIGIPQILDKGTDLSRVRDKAVAIADVLESSPAQTQGIQVGDKILSINGQMISSAAQVYQMVEQFQSEQILLVADRNRETKYFYLTPVKLKDGSVPMIGIGVVDSGVVKYNIAESIWRGVVNTVLFIGLIFTALYNLLVNLIRSGQLDAGLSGPVGVAVITGQIVKLGFVHALQFLAILSINLGVLNILPFPALDGGRLLFITIEKIRGKKVSGPVEGWIHNSGFVLLIILLIFVTYRDLGRYGGQIWQSLKIFFK